MERYRALDKSRMIILLLFILIGGILRLYNLGHNSFWYDEASSIILAQHISTIHKQLGTDAPLFFMMLNLWLHLGQSEFVTRLLPALIGILTLPVFFFVFRKLLDERVALYATAFLAISPFQIYYAQELRCYTLLPFLALISNHFFILALKDNKKSYWIFFTIFAVLSLYTHYFAVFSLFANFLYFVFFMRSYRNRIINYFLYNVLILLLYSPWLLIFINRTLAFEKYSKFWILQPKYKDLIITVKNFIIGYGAPKWAFYVSTIIGVLLLIKAMPFIFKTKNNLFIAFQTGIPIVVTFLMSKISANSIYLDRCMIISSLFFLALISIAITNIKKKWLRIIIFLVININACVSLYYIYNNVIPRLDHNFGVRPRKEFRQGAMYIKSQLKDGDLIGHGCRSSLPVFMVYVPEVENLALATNQVQINYEKKKYPFLDMWDTPLGQQTLPHLVDEAVAGKQRLWYVWGQWDLGIQDYYYQTSEEIKDYLQSKYQLISLKEYYGIKIYLFSLDKNSPKS